MANDLKETAQKILSLGNIEINGENSWDIQVHNAELYKRVLAHGSIGLGESYMDKWWDAGSLDKFFEKLLASKIDQKIKADWFLVWELFSARIFNLQSRSRAYQVGQRHYDLGNDIFKAMLDKSMTYTCGYFKGTDDLDQAQENKLDLVCQKLRLKPGMKILDIGCGWGSLLRHAAVKYGVSGVGLTVSKEQAQLAKELCAGLPIEIRLQDYRQVDGKFDAIASLGMIEHVGYKNYRKYMEVAYRCLGEGGLFLLHTIGNNKSVKTTDAWMNKYIFPNGMLPSIMQLGASIENLFVMEDWHNFGTHYDKTLLAWFDNFNSNWDGLKDKYGERFYRMWKYYLLSCAAVFRVRNTQLWQIVLSKDGIRGGYDSIR